MPLRIGYEADHDLDTPVVICDFCHERITTAREGNAVRRAGSSGPVDGVVYFTHKQCHDAFEHATPEPAYWLDAD